MNTGIIASRYADALLKYVKAVSYTHLTLPTSLVV